MTGTTTSPWKRKEVIGDCTLYLGDCLEVLPAIGQVDHVFCDPPYEKEAHKEGRRTQASIKHGVNADLDFAMITEDIRQQAAQLTVAASGGWCLYFCQAEAAGDWRDAIEAAGGKYKRTMVWIKPDSTPQLNGAMPAPGYESMPLAWCGKGHSRWNAGGKRGVYTHLTNPRNRDGRHPTEKPTALMSELLIDFTNPGEVVCDPFMGSGTTGVCAARLGRRFVGIEMDERYFDVACERIAAVQSQPDMFTAQAKPKQLSILDRAL